MDELGSVRLGGEQEKGAPEDAARDVADDREEDDEEEEEARVDEVGDALFNDVAGGDG